MWPETKYLLSSEQLDLFNEQFSDTLDTFIINEGLDSDFRKSFKSTYVQLAYWITHKQTTGSVVFGVNGAQGSGKSTLCKLLSLILREVFNKSVLHLSIDDLYLSHEARIHLSNELHPLLKVRGVPGTHNAQLGIDILDNIKSHSNKRIKVPVFNKVTDDLLPENQWPTISDNIDMVLFEGWCVASKPQSDKELQQSVNELEEKEDSDLSWRSYVNNQLSGSYADLFSHIDQLIMLKVPDMESVFEWRSLQEKKLAESNLNIGVSEKIIMSDKDIKRFIMFFERLTLACLNEMPGRADVVLNLDNYHQIDSIFIKQ